MRPGELHEVVLGLGANCGDRRGNVKRGLARLEALFPGLRHSEIYETPDSHGGPRKYMNAVAMLRTSASPTELQVLTKGLERDFGRDTDARLRGDVPLDVDVVVYDRQVLKPRDFAAPFFTIGLRQLMDSDSNSGEALKKTSDISAKTEEKHG